MVFRSTNLLHSNRQCYYYSILTHGELLQAPSLIILNRNRTQNVSFILIKFPLTVQVPFTHDAWGSFMFTSPSSHPLSGLSGQLDSSTGQDFIFLGNSTKAAGNGGSQCSSKTISDVHTDIIKRSGKHEVNKQSGILHIQGTTNLQRRKHKNTE